MGRSYAKVWNSPRSPHGSTPAGTIEKSVIVRTPGKSRWTLLWVNASWAALQTGRDHGSAEFGRGQAPKWKQGFESGTTHSLFPTATDVIKE
jgi:hypothetical protein